MQAATIFDYLAGGRAAILDVASDRGALGVAAILVLSAGLARNYDRASLGDEPWRLLGPFAASLAISVPLFLVLHGVVWVRGRPDPHIVRCFLSFLALYWMMAPMAWLYGIPYERFLPPVDAIRANLWTLALVSLWRVALMARVASVFFGLPVMITFPVVMLVVDIAALVALYCVPLPVIPIMTGMNPEQDVIAWASLLAKLLAWVSLPVWAGWALFVILCVPSQVGWGPEPAEPTPRGGHGGLVLALLILAAWGAVLFFTQPEQILAHRVDRTYREHGPGAALDLIATHEPTDFPPDWRPPPTRFPGQPPTSEVLDMLAALAERPYPDWLTERVLGRFLERLSHDEYVLPDELLDQHVVRFADIVARLPRGPELAEPLKSRISYGLSDSSARDRTAEQRDALRRLLRLLRLIAPDESLPDTPAADPAEGRPDEATPAHPEPSP